MIRLVQLTTTYDKDIGMKTYVLKGDEAYAKTTDTVMNIIEFDDSYEHRFYTRLGLEFATYRMIGDASYINIILNDEILNENPIPWVENPTAETFADFDYLTWDDERKVLIWGDNDDSDTGLFLPYDYDNEFYIKFYGNKQCLKSESKHHIVNKKIPSEFDCSITLTSPSPIYPDGKIDDLVVTFTSDRTIENTKTIDIYDGETYIKSVTVTKDEPTTVPSFHRYADNLHTLHAVFEGDDEASPTSTEYDISIGINYSNVVAPSVRIDLTEFDVSVTALDWFGNPIPNIELCLMNSTGNSSFTEVSSYVATDSDGNATLVCTQTIGDRFRIRLKDNNRKGMWSSSFYIYEIEPAKIVCTYDPIISRNIYSNITAYLSTTSTEPYERIEMSGIPIELRIRDRTGTETVTIYTDESGYATYNLKGWFLGDIDCRLRYCKNKSCSSAITNLFTIEDVLLYASNSPSGTTEYYNEMENLTKVTTGYKLSDGDSTRFYNGIYEDPRRMQYEFDLIGGGTCHIRCGIIKQLNEYVSVNSTSHIKIVKLNSSDKTSMNYSVYVDDELKGTYSRNYGYNYVGLDAVDGDIILNNLKTKRLPDE